MVNSYNHTLAYYEINIIMRLDRTRHTVALCALNPVHKVSANCQGADYPLVKVLAPKASLVKVLTALLSLPKRQDANHAPQLKC